MNTRSMLLNWQELHLLRQEIVSPAIRQTTDNTAELRITLLNFLHTRMDVSAGKIIRLEINKAPIIRIPSTIVTAVSTAISVL